jgi:hypothetical protein
MPLLACSLHAQLNRTACGRWQKRIIALRSSAYEQHRQTGFRRHVSAAPLWTGTLLQCHCEAFTSSLATVLGAMTPSNTACRPVVSLCRTLDVNHHLATVHYGGAPMQEPTILPIMLSCHHRRSPQDSKKSPSADRLRFLRWVVYILNTQRYLPSR